MTSVRDVEQLVAQRSGGWVPRGLLGPTSEQLAQLAANEAWWFVEVSLGEVTDKKALMRILAERLRFPDSFGANWDALADALWDLGEDCSGSILRLKGLGEIPAMLADPLAEILDERTKHGPRPLVIVADPPLPPVASSEQEDREREEDS